MTAKHINPDVIVTSQHTTGYWEDEFPCIRATLGIDWLLKMAGRMTDVELLRQEAFSLRLLIERRHEAECESAATAILDERAAIAKATGTNK